MGFDRDQLLKFVFNFLNLTEQLKNSDIIIEPYLSNWGRPIATNGPIDICVM